MKPKLDRRVLNAIEKELLRELHIEGDELLKILKRETDRASFNAAKYKEREAYEDLIKIKRSYNILKAFLTVTKR